MKKQLLFLLTFILSLQAFSQIDYEQGYFISNANQKIDCLIKNMDWKSNPTEFEYKLAENDDPKTKVINTVKEFGIYDISKYIRQTVKIDRSRERVSNLSDTRNPIFEEEILFLNVLIEGDASLYEYNDGDLKRFFYSIENSDIEQLVFKSYRTSENKIGKNNLFRQQLWNGLSCPAFTLNKVNNLKYNKSQFVRFFKDYNDCNNHVYKSFENKQKRDFFNLNIRPGINNSSLLIVNTLSPSRLTDFDNKLSFRLGIEAEFIMPFNKNKWAIIIEPTYQNFKLEKEVINGTAKVDYKSIELPIGIRHYFFLNDKSKIFINGSFIPDFSLSSGIEFSKYQDIDIKTVVNVGLGLGYKYDRYSLEMRYQTNREILTNYTYWKSEYKTFAFIFGYSLF